MSREKDKEKAAAAARSAKSVIRSDAVSLDWRDERDEVATAAADAAAAASLRAGEKPPPPDAAELAALPKRGQFAIDARAYGHFQKLHANLPCQTLEELKKYDAAFSIKRWKLQDKAWATPDGRASNLPAGLLPKLAGRAAKRPAQPNLRP